MVPSIVLTNGVVKMAGGASSPSGPSRPGAHPIHVHPARPLYRISATLLGASMWFFVRIVLLHSDTTTNGRTVDVSSQERWPRFDGMETSVGSLNDEDGEYDGERDVHEIP
jgi:hypothetical protein